MPSRKDNFYQHSDIIIERMIIGAGLSQNMFAEKVLGIKGVNVIRAKKTGKIPERWFEIMLEKFSMSKDELCKPPARVRATVEHPYGFSSERETVTTTHDPLQYHDGKGSPPLDASVKNELMGMTSEVLDSDTVYRPALVSNIRAFYHGVKGEKEMGNMHEEMKAMRRDMAELKEMMRNMAGSSELEKKRARDAA